MSEYTVNRDRFLDLVGTVCDDGASQDECAELDSIMLADREAFQCYLDFCRMHSSLRLELRAHQAVQGACERAGIDLSSCGGRDTMGMLAIAIPALRSTHAVFSPSFTYLSSGWPVAYLIATVVLGIGLLVGAITKISSPVQTADKLPPKADQRLAALPTQQSVGRVTGMVDCQFSDQSTITFSGAYVSIGRKYVLSSGFMEITYDTGAKVILQGPVDYEVELKNGGFMSRGKLTGKMKVETARGFVVRTPTATVTDIGTEFGMEVDQQGCTNAYLFSGLIEVQPNSTNGSRPQPIRLKENESVRISRQSSNGGTIVDRNTIDGKAFVRVGKLPRIIEERRLKLFHQWQAYSKKLQNDPSLVVYYTFEKNNGSAAVLENHSPTGNALSGTIQDAEWVSGRMPGKLGLQFHGPGNNNAVVVPEPQRFAFRGPFSVAMWFRVPKFTEKWQVLIAKGGWSWRIHRHADTDVLDFTTNDGKWMPGRTNVADGKWHLVVAVHESPDAGGRKLLYIDGRLDAEDKSTKLSYTDDEPLRIGANSLPNRRESRGLDGTIDEVAIFSRAISLDEVAAMYQAGNPQSPVAGGGD